MYSKTFLVRKYAFMQKLLYAAICALKKATIFSTICAHSWENKFKGISYEIFFLRHMYSTTLVICKYAFTQKLLYVAISALTKATIFSTICAHSWENKFKGTSSRDFLSQTHVFNKLSDTQIRIYAEIAIRSHMCHYKSNNLCNHLCPFMGE